MTRDLRARFSEFEVPPGGRAHWRYRFLVGLLRFLAGWVFAIRVELRGAANLPRDGTGRLVGGWIAAPVPHVRWIDPLLLVLGLPLEPRPMFFGSGPAIFTAA